MVKSQEKKTESLLGFFSISEQKDRNLINYALTASW